jgi:outer membrane protein assembly factor BamB
MPRPNFTKRYGSTLFIFPAIIPLVELLPWFLTLIGAITGAIQLFSKALRRRKMVLYLCILICAGSLAAAGWLVWKRTANQPVVAVGSELSSAMPKLETISTQQRSPMPTGNLKPLTQLWKITTSQRNLGKPLVRNNVLLVGTWEKTLNSFDITDGHALWILHKNEPIFTQPSVAADYIFIGEGYHTSPVCELTALTLTGKPLWTRRFRSHLESSPTVDLENNRLWNAGGATGLWALSADKGEKLWWRKLGHMDVSPLYRNKRLFAIARLKDDADGSAVFELNPDNGDIRWEAPLEGNTMGGLHSDGELIYISTALGQVGDKKPTDTGWVNALTIDGKVIWKVKLPAMPLPEGVLSRDGSLLFYALKNGNIIALNTKDGSVAWSEKIGSEIQTDIALIEDGADSYIVGIANDGNVSIREMKTGKEYVHFSVEQGDSNSVYANGILYIATPTTISAYVGFAGER